MSTFWNVVAVIFIVGVVLLVTDITADGADPGVSTDAGIHFTDLETECRYGKNIFTDIGKQDNSITFQGRFHVSDPDSDVDYDFSVSGNQINLNIFTEDLEPLTDYQDTCTGLVAYDGKTRSLEPGLYDINLMHQGEKVEEVSIRVR